MTHYSVCFGVCLFLHLSCLVFSELPGSVIWCEASTWGKFSVIFLQIFLLFVSPPSDISIMHKLHFLFVPLFLDIMFRVFFPVFFLFAFEVWTVSIDIASRSESISSAVSTLLMSPSEAFFIFVTVFLISCTSFCLFFFLEFPSFCLHCPSILTCCLPFEFELLEY